MKKKMIASVLLMSLSLSLLTGCGGNAAPESTEEQVTVEATTEDTEEETKEDTEEVSEESEEESTEAKESSASDGSFSPDNVVEATLENPAKIGEWVATKKYSPIDDEDHTIYYRITGVLRGEEAQKIIDEYHAGDNFYEFTDLEDDDLEYCVLTYETYFPPEFPEQEYEGDNLGVTSVYLDFDVCNLEDYGSIEHYLGLSTWNITEEPHEFFAGNTFTEGRAVMTMIKDFDEYLIYPDYDYEHKTYIRGE